MEVLTPLLLFSSVCVLRAFFQSCRVILATETPHSIFPWNTECCTQALPISLPPEGDVWRLCTFCLLQEPPTEHGGAGRRGKSSLALPPACRSSLRIVCFLPVSELSQLHRPVPAAEMHVCRHHAWSCPGVSIRGPQAPTVGAIPELAGGSMDGLAGSNGSCWDLHATWCELFFVLSHLQTVQLCWPPHCSEGPSKAASQKAGEARGSFSLPSLFERSHGPRESLSALNRAGLGEEKCRLSETLFSLQCGCSWVLCSTRIQRSLS